MEDYLNIVKRIFTNNAYYPDSTTTDYSLLLQSLFVSALHKGFDRDKEIAEFTSNEIGRDMICHYFFQCINSNEGLILESKRLFMYNVLTSLFSGDRKEIVQQIVNTKDDYVEGDIWDMMRFILRAIKLSPDGQLSLDSKRAASGEIMMSPNGIDMSNLYLHLPKRNIRLPLKQQN